MVKNTENKQPPINFKIVYAMHLGKEFKKILLQHYCMHFDYSEEAFRKRATANSFSPAEKEFLYAQLKENATHITKAYSFEQLFGSTQLSIDTKN
jgi:hypothetical protein